MTRLPPLHHGTEAVVCFTGHAYIATRFSARQLADMGADGFGGVRRPELLVSLSADGVIGTEDMTTVSTGLGDGRLLLRTDPDPRPRPTGPEYSR